MINRTHISLLKTLHRFGFKSAVIAGGAIRDDFFKHEVKDIDFFIWHPSYSSENISYSDEFLETHQYNVFVNTLTSGKPVKCVDEILIDDIIRNHSNIFVADDPEPETEDQYDETRILEVWNFMDVKAKKPIQFVFVAEDPINYVQTGFDIGLCMCYFDGKIIRYTHNFLKDFRNKTLTICGVLNEYEFEYSITHHLQRLKAKFPGYTAQVAPELEDLLTPALRKLL